MSNTTQHFQAQLNHLAEELSTEMDDVQRLTFGKVLIRDLPLVMRIAALAYNYLRLRELSAKE